MINKLVESALKFPGLVIVALIAVLSLGIYKYQHMPVDAFPDISPVMVPVFAEGHGMAPEEMERLVTYPIESAMNGLPKVKQIKSTSAFGLAVIYVYFEDDVDIYFARQLVSERLTSAMTELPEMDQPPTLGPISTGLGQIFIYYCHYYYGFFAYFHFGRRRRNNVLPAGFYHCLRVVGVNFCRSFCCTCSFTLPFETL